MVDPARRGQWIEYSTYTQLVALAGEAHVPSSASASASLGAGYRSCRSEYNCSDRFVLETSRSAALEQYLLMTKVSENFASTASCQGFV